jgi:hypothetical protein
MKNFEIHDLTANEILADNLDFEEVPELFKAYADFYSSHEIVFCERIDEDIVIPIHTNKKLSNRAEFQAQWLMLVAYNLCNFY